MPLVKIWRLSNTELRNSDLTLMCVSQRLRNLLPKIATYSNSSSTAKRTKNRLNLLGPDRATSWSLSQPKQKFKGLPPKKAKSIDVRKPSSLSRILPRMRTILTHE
jgi:hypothetical protein